MRIFSSNAKTMPTIKTQRSNCECIRTKKRGKISATSSSKCNEKNKIYAHIITFTFREEQLKFNLKQSEDDGKNQLNSTEQMEQKRIIHLLLHSCSSLNKL